MIVFRLHRLDWVLPPETLLFLLPIFVFVAFPSGNLTLGAIWITVVFPVALVIGAAVRAVSALATYAFDEPLRRALQPKRPPPIPAETTPAR